MGCKFMVATKENMERRRVSNGKESVLRHRHNACPARLRTNSTTTTLLHNQVRLVAHIILILLLPTHYEHYNFSGVRRSERHRRGPQYR